ncbi:methylaspartate mutase [Actinokineospora guangxiensis]|uniref:Methylaspartate mutase n=1 Tax=Actinokineospora guangxiensis TaxID=1490288 RepID=A0ABW0EKX0_9PSEU
MTGAFPAAVAAAPGLVVQPRMGMADPAAMRAGLLAVKRAAATTVGTLTLDSYTRVGDADAALAALREGRALNGYPIVAHPREVTRAVLDGVADAGFPVQVRHGSADPRAIFARMAELGLAASEGGPVSYCLPYSRRPLRESTAHWTEACARLAETVPGAHLETFGGCLMGQLCPPSLLIAISVLEGMFFRANGIRSVSLSYSQQTNQDQDAEAVRALRAAAACYLPDVDWHVVLYTYMGVYPSTPGGARLLLAAAARLAAGAGARRLIVKTVAEAHRIPTVAENVAALEEASAAASAAPPLPEADTGLLAEARAIIDAVLGLHDDIGQAMVTAFHTGLLDVPYCLHPDNANQARCHIDDTGWLRWSAAGGLPLPRSAVPARADRLGSSELVAALSHVAARFDAAAL